MKTINPGSSSKDSDFGRGQYLYLTTRGRKSGLPRGIEIWFTSREGRFYVIAEYQTSQWLQNLRADPEAKVRVEGKSFAAHARIISSQEEPELHQAVADLSHAKYGWGEGCIVELTPDVCN